MIDSTALLRWPRIVEGQHDQCDGRGNLSQLLIRDVDGYTSLRFSMENEDGINLLVVTADRLFLVVTVSPKGSPDAVASPIGGRPEDEPAD